MNNLDDDVGTEDDWEDEEIFYSSTEHNDKDEDVSNDDVKSVFEDDWMEICKMMMETVILKSQVMLVM
eukprot:13422236-Ditylum_brightwellii.AAC.2